MDRTNAGAHARLDVRIVVRGVGPRWNEESLSRLMANADANADGKLQLQEFVNWIFSSKGTYSTAEKEQMIDEVMAELEG